MRVGYFPGCSLDGSSREYDESLRASAAILGLDLVEVPDWNCCGATAAHCLNHKLALSLPARVLALAERAGLSEVLVPCAACFNRLASTRHELAHDAALRKEIGRIIEIPVEGSTAIVNTLDVFGRFAANGLADRVRQPFGRKVACYYGCYLTRPTAISSCARTEDPQEMDAIVRAVGGEPIDWAFKVECCGAGLSVSRLSSVATLSARIVDDAVTRGADAIVVACPMCHTNLDLRRSAIEEALGRSITIPVLYVTQVVGLALGLSERRLGMHRHHVPVRWAEATATAAPVATGAAPAAREPALHGTESKKG